MNCHFQPLSLSLLFLLMFVLSGCSKSDPLNRQSVSGKVILGGEALANGSIEFHPTSESGTMSGAVITAGKYSIAAARGLPPGEYLIRIYSADESAEPIEIPGESNLIAVEKIPEEYNVNSDQRRTIEDGKKNIFDFDIPNSED